MLILKNNNFDDMPLITRDTLHFQYWRLVNYGSKSLKVAGPKAWNDLPDKIRALSSVCLFKRRVKSRLLDTYCSAEIVKNHYYVSKFSMWSWKFNISKMKTFFVPPYLPALILPRKV